MNDLMLAFTQLMEALRIPKGNRTPSFHRPTPGTPKSGKTRKGATHKQGAHFLGRKIFKGTPAEYRRRNLGIVSIVPNYKKPHPKPKGRNVWTSK